MTSDFVHPLKFSPKLSSPINVHIPNKQQQHVLFCVDPIWWPPKFKEANFARETTVESSEKLKGISVIKGHIDIKPIKHMNHPLLPRVILQVIW